jgi:hypothetical protein
MLRPDALTVNRQVRRHCQTLGACSRHTSACTYSSAPVHPPSTFFRHVANPSDDDVNLPLTQTQPHVVKLVHQTRTNRGLLYFVRWPLIFLSCGYATSFVSPLSKPGILRWLLYYWKILAPLQHAQNCLFNMLNIQIQTNMNGIWNFLSDIF